MIYTYKPIVTLARSASAKPSTSLKTTFLDSVGVIVPLKARPSILTTSTTISSLKGPSGSGVLKTGGMTGMDPIFSL